MRRRVLVVPNGLTPRRLGAILRRWARSEGRLVRQERELRPAAGGRHWHLTTLTRGGGTLEVTLEETDPPRVYVDVHDNRTGAWALTASPRFCEDLRRRLKRELA